MNTTITHDVFDTTVIHDGTEYHFLKDGHYYFEYPGLSPAESEDAEMVNSPKIISNDNCPSPQKKSKIQFSTDPIKVSSSLIFYFV